MSPSALELLHCTMNSAQLYSLSHRWFDEQEQHVNKILELTETLLFIIKRCVKPYYSLLNELPPLINQSNLRTASNNINILSKIIHLGEEFQSICLNALPIQKKRQMRQCRKNNLTQNSRLPVMFIHCLNFPVLSTVRHSAACPSPPPLWELKVGLPT